MTDTLPDDVSTDPGLPAIPEPPAALPVPEPAPALPAPDLDDELQPLDPQAVSLWRIGGAISTGIWSAIIGAMSVPIALYFSPNWIPTAAGALALVILNAVLRIAVVPPVRYRLWRYQLREDQLFLQRGFLVIRRTLIPLVRVQNVDTVQGPIARRFGLWSVVVFTAANAQSIPALSQKQADRLRETIAELARRAKDEA